MKKNLMTVIILALVLANLVLTAILAFTIIPQTQKSNELIDEVCAAINLELESGQNKDYSDIPIEDIEVYAIEDQFTINLRNSGGEDDDGKKHYAVFSVALSMNTKSEGYTTYGGSDGLAEKESIIRDTINSVVSTYTVDQFNENSKENVKADILSAVQALFGNSTDFIVGVNFSSAMTE